MLSLPHIIDYNYNVTRGRRSETGAQGTACINRSSCGTVVSRDRPIAVHCQHLVVLHYLRQQLACCMGARQARKAGGNVAATASSAGSNSCRTTPAPISSLVSHL